MKKLLNGVVKVGSRVFEFCMPDEETLSRMSEKYTKMYHADYFRR